MATKPQAGLVDMVNEMQSFWSTQIGEMVRQAGKVFEKSLISELNSELHTSHKHALEYFAELCDDWHPSSFLAFYRKDGKHKTKAVAEDSWNERLLEHQTREVSNPAWQLMLPQQMGLFDGVVAKLTAAIEALPDDLSLQPATVSLPIAAFKALIDAQVNGIKNILETERENYRMTLANVKLDAELDQHTGFFAQAMQPCYDEGRDYHGTGVTKRCKDLVYRHLTKEDPLGDVKESLSLALNTKAEFHADVLKKRVKVLLKDITKSFESILQKQPETSAERKARAQLLPFLARTMPDVKRTMADVARIRQSYGVV